MPISAIDLFCGVGGLTHGLIQEGIPVAAGLDLDETCRFAYEANNEGAKFLTWDVGNVGSADVEALYPDDNGVRVLAGCAPCQPFSLYSNRGAADVKWKLLESFGRLAVGIRPEIVTMENVAQLSGHQVFADFVRSLEGAGYCVTHFVAYGPDYGIPQRRKRLILFASLAGPIDIIAPTHPNHDGTTLREAIGHLPPIAAGEVSANDPLHRCRNITPLNLKRLRSTPEGGGWEDWDEDLLLECHKKETGQTYKSVYGRMSWEEPGPVVTTQCIGIGNGRFGHPDQDRALSLREAAILQTFPQDYELLDPARKRVSMQAIARQVGNAVPVRLGRVVAKSILRHVEVALD